MSAKPARRVGPNEKHFIVRLHNPYIPVMKNGWQFVKLPEAPAATAQGVA